MVQQCCEQGCCVKQLQRAHLKCTPITPPLPKIFYIRLSTNNMRVRILFVLLVLYCSPFTAAAQTLAAQPDSSQRVWTVQTSCGTCQFGMKGGDCALAVRFKGKAYFTDGATIDAFGDAHAKDGFCNAVRKAQVQGKVENNRFKVTWFKLLPEALPQKGEHQHR